MGFIERPRSGNLHRKAPSFRLLPAVPCALESAPHPLRGKRHFEIRHAKLTQRIERGAHQRRGRADRAGLTAALGAERIVGAGLALVALVTKSGRSSARAIA